MVLWVSSLLLLVSTVSTLPPANAFALVEQSPAVAPAPGQAPVAATRNGRIAFTENTDAGGFDIFTIRPDGSDRLRLTRNGNSTDPAYAPAGRRIAFTRCDVGECDVWVMDARGDRKRPLIAGPGTQADPAWSPDGSEIAYVGETEFGRQLFIYSLATGTSKQLTSASAVQGPRAAQPAWSPEGGRIAFHRFTVHEDSLGGAEADPGAIYLVRTDGTHLRQVTPLGRLSLDPPMGRG